jgi:hypothetical protein
LEGVTFSPIRWTVIVALLLASGSFIVVALLDEGKLLDWFIQLAATSVAAILAVVGGVWLFHYADRETEEKLRTKLKMRVALEVKVNLERLESAPTVFMQKSSDKVLGRAVTVELSTVAIRDLIHSVLIETDDTLYGMRLEGRINVHNSKVATLLAWRTGTIPEKSVNRELSELNAWQEALSLAFKELLENLRKEGIEVSNDLEG